MVAFAVAFDVALAEAFAVAVAEAFAVEFKVYMAAASVVLAPKVLL